MHLRIILFCFIMQFGSVLRHTRSQGESLLHTKHEVGETRPPQVWAGGHHHRHQEHQGGGGGERELQVPGGPGTRVV